MTKANVSFLVLEMKHLPFLFFTLYHYRKFPAFNIRLLELLILLFFHHWLFRCIICELCHICNA